MIFEVICLDFLIWLGLRLGKGSEVVSYPVYIYFLHSVSQGGKKKVHKQLKFISAACINI